VTELPSSLSVRVQDVSKKYRIGHAISQDEALGLHLGRALLSPLRNLRWLRSVGRFREDERDGEDVIWALRDISFDARPGEVLGVVGRNGAGKSTLLKVLSRITEPTAGRAWLRGRVSSLLEVGTGFHPDLTGRENVYLNGTMLGMTRQEVTARLDEIVGFAEIEKFLDTPVKRYSSGMYVRLAFSVAAHLEPDVLIADEVLAVGDAAFQQKCIGEMRTVADSGHTVILVSHNLSVVSALCDRALWLDRGELRADGEVDPVLAAYSRALDEGHQDVLGRSDRLGSGRLMVTSLVIRKPEGVLLQTVPAGTTVEFVLDYVVIGAPVDHLVVAITIETLLREPVTTLSNGFTGESLEVRREGGQLVCRVDGLPLNEGDYMCTVRLEADGHTADWIADVTRFRVDPASFFPTRAYPGVKSGLVLLRHSWSSGEDEPAN
jgi:lipopolysaccharide transport system ATP-binding protein